MAEAERTTVTLNLREQEMIAAHMRENAKMWDTPSDFVHDSIRVFHVILKSKAIEALVHKALKETQEP